MPAARCGTAGGSAAFFAPSLTPTVAAGWIRMSDIRSFAAGASGADAGVESGAAVAAAEGTRGSLPGRSTKRPTGEAGGAAAAATISDDFTALGADAGATSLAAAG